MDDPTALSGLPRTHMPELSNAMHGFTVVDRTGERIGTVRKANLSRTCILVESPRPLFGRKQTYAVHALAVGEIDLDRFLISLTATKQQVTEAPGFRDLNSESEAAIALHYYDRITSNDEANTIS